MSIFREITIYSILRSYAEQNDKIVISHKIGIIWEFYDYCIVPVQCLGYTAKKFLD